MVPFVIPICFVVVMTFILGVFVVDAIYKKWKKGKSSVGFRFLA